MFSNKMDMGMRRVLLGIVLMALAAGCGKVVEIGGGSLGEEVNGPVEKDGHASKPDGQKEDGPVAKEAEEKVHGELGDFGVISQ